MIIKLTNANETFKGNPVLINMDKIVSVFSVVNEKDETITFLYYDKENTWQVSETTEEIYEMVSK
jgi:hypothetical protein